MGRGEGRGGGAKGEREGEGVGEKGEEKLVYREGIDLKGRERKRRGDRRRESTCGLTIHSEQFPTPPTSSWNSVSVMRGKAVITTQNLYSRPTPSLLPIPPVPLIPYRGQNE